MPTNDTRIRPRAILTGLSLVFVISLLSPWAILMVKGSQLTSNAIPIVAVLFLFVLTAGVLPLLRSLGSAWDFSRQESIAVYIMMIVGSVVVTTGFTGSFLSIISGAMYYATPENEWRELFGPYIHPWLAPENSEAVRLFFEGLPKGMPIPWAAWTKPLVAWIAFILIFYWVTLCLGVLLRGQWVENERLVFLSILYHRKAHLRAHRPTNRRRRYLDLRRCYPPHRPPASRWTADLNSIRAVDGTRALTPPVAASPQR